MSSYEDSLDDIEYLRAKWMFDGAKTLDGVIERLHNQIKYIEHLKEEGWELIAEVNDDYGPMRQNPSLPNK
jgi:hypothetical protein